MRTLLVSLVSLLALPLLAVEIIPAAPTTATPVSAIFRYYASCPPPPEVTRVGNAFHVLLKQGPCLSPPALVAFTVDFGKLAPGDYEVIGEGPYNGGVARVDYGAFFVRDADATIIVLGQSFGPTTGGTQVTLLPGSAVNCSGAHCPLPQVLFNGAPAKIDTDAFARGQLVVTAPPGAKGVADVVVVGSAGTTSGRVFRYYDPNEGPLPSMFERVLVPVWFSGPGAFGSNWTTDVTMLNPNSFGFEPYRRSPLPFVAAMSTIRLDFGASRAGGVLFFSPRDFTPAPRFGSLVRDLSRNADDWGTEVRVVRESDFRTAEFSLINVPVDARFRATLRIYDADSVESQVGVFAYAMDGTVLAFKTVQLRSATPCPPFQPCASDDPAYAQVDLLALFPEIAGQPRVRLTLRPATGARTWAFATITNNATQHVTVITPQ
jgi:hypothetical protein